ncbi:MAG: M55 family metallopeptidase [Cellulosilyticaceae bacterium]
MRIYISADIEGITGVSNWYDTGDEIGNGGAYEAAKLQMTREVAAVCRGLLSSGVTEILIKDAHGSGKNLIHNLLPKEVKIISQWSNHPYGMVEGLDATFDGVIFVGYHSDAKSNASPLAHTLCPRTIKSIKINGEEASEFLIYTYAAYMVGVPVIAVTGDGGLIRKVRSFNPTIQTLAVQEGFGDAIVSIHPEVALERAEVIAKKALENIGSYTVNLEDHFKAEVTFASHKDAYKYSFYPGAKQVDEFTISYESNQYMDILTLLMFI